MTAQALVFQLAFFGPTPLKHQAIVIEQFLTALDIAQGHDENTRALGIFLGFAIGRAGMVDPARIIAIHAAVNHQPATGGKKEGMERIVRIGRVTGIRFFGRNAFAQIFKNAGPFRDVTRGKDTVSMQG